MSKEVLKAVKAHLEAAGFRPIVSVTGSGHYKVAVAIGSAQPHVIVPSTASCRRALKNAVAQCSRTFGIVTVRSKSSRPKHHRAAAKRSSVCSFLRTTEPASNPAQSLADQLAALSLRMA